MEALTMKEKRKITVLLAQRYRKARKKEKSRILDEFVKLTTYNRNYAGWKLANYGKAVFLQTKKGKIIFKPDLRKRKRRFPSKKYYDKDFKKVLCNVWGKSYFLCGKLLVGYIKETVPILESLGEISIPVKEREKLYKVSAATIDRLLRGEKRKLLKKARSGTKPGTLLKDRIPIKTYHQWDNSTPGFVDVDLVQHEGGDPSGEFNQTLDVVDVATQWSEQQAVLNKAQVWVFEAMKDIRKRFPFEIRGINSDNGHEFINHIFYRYCNQEKITFTRSRHSNKNDNCHVEQKNYSIVRREIGYARYEGEKELKLLNEFYKRLRLVRNFFTPCRKLIAKKVINGKTRRIYDKPKTPYLRVLESPSVPEKAKENLRQQRAKLNPMALRREMMKIKDKLNKLASKRRKHQAELYAINTGLANVRIFA